MANLLIILLTLTFFGCTSWIQSIPYSEKRQQKIWGMSDYSKSRMATSFYQTYEKQQTKIRGYGSQIFHSEVILKSTKEECMELKQWCPGSFERHGSKFSHSEFHSYVKLLYDNTENVCSCIRKIVK